MLARHAAVVSLARLICAQDALRYYDAALLEFAAMLAIDALCRRHMFMPPYGAMLSLRYRFFAADACHMPIRFRHADAAAYLSSRDAIMLAKRFAATVSCDLYKAVP